MGIASLGGLGGRVTHAGSVMPRAASRSSMAWAVLMPAASRSSSGLLSSARLSNSSTFEGLSSRRIKPL
ncbi:hypothetical protein OY671_008358 [Metschnikowia pulcherrima]|nr:hypothetical protein OY671_008358 [Metschnikowia pulcherrima]